LDSVACSVVIVNFNGGKLMTECVDSVLKSNVPVQVLVSDNNSSDGSIDYLNSRIQDARLHVKMNDSNLGFSKGVNMVVPLAKGEYILFLNPDCVVQPDIIKEMVCKIEKRPDVGMAGCLILNLDGSEQAGCRRRVPTPWRTMVRVLHLPVVFPKHHRFQDIALSKEVLPDTEIEVEAISGAFMLVRREALEDVGLLDEHYFLHCEDLDWCMRFRKRGWKILFVPDVEISHAQGECSQSRPVRVEWYKHKGMIRFYRKFFRHQYPLPLMLLVILTVWIRFTVIAVRHSFRWVFL